MSSPSPDLEGEGGDDLLAGGGGQDLLHGRTGGDVLLGDAGGPHAHPLEVSRQ